MAIIIGLQKSYWAAMTQDNEGAPLYSAPTRLYDVRSINVTPQNLSQVVDGDDHPVETLTETPSATIDIEWAKQTSAERAMLLGEQTQDGIIVSGGTNNAPYGAVGYVRTMSGGKYRFVWILKCKFAPTAENAQTKQQGSLTPQYPGISGTAIQRTADVALRITKDSDTDISATWFTAATLMTLYNGATTVFGKPAEVKFVSADPATPVAGVIYVNATGSTAKYWDGDSLVTITPLA